MIMSTINWEDEMSTKFQRENYSSRDMTTMAKRSSMMPSYWYMIYFNMAVVAIGVLGILTNGLVLACFCFAGRAKMNASSFHIANHTTLGQSTCLNLRILYFLDLHTI